MKQENKNSKNSKESRKIRIQLIMLIFAHIVGCVGSILGQAYLIAYILGVGVFFLLFGASTCISLYTIFNYNSGNSQRTALVKSIMSGIIIFFGIALFGTVMGYILQQTETPLPYVGLAYAGIVTSLLYVATYALFKQRKCSVGNEKK